MGYTCFICHAIIEGHVSKLLAHIHNTHALYDGRRLILKCGQGACPSSFSSFNSFRNHIVKKHPVLNERVVELDQNEDMEDADEDAVEDDIEVDVDEDTDNDVGDEDDGNVGDTVKRQAAMFLTAMLAQTNMTHTTLGRLVESVSDMVHTLVSRLEGKTRRFLQNNGIDLESQACSNLFECFSFTGNPFTGLESRYRRYQYLVQELGLVQSRTVVLGTRYDTITDDRSGEAKQVVVRDTFQYISIKETLGVVLSDKTVMKEVNLGHQSEDGVMRDYCDGAQYKRHPLLSSLKDSIQLCVFFDEYEMVNPLGSKRGVHKVGALYYIIQNLPPRYNSTLHNIHMLALFHSVDLANYGFPPILVPFLEELAQLESDGGMEIRLRNGATVTKRGTLTQVSADNLGANSIGGYVESFTANYPCRFCLTLRFDMQECFIAKADLQRTRANYEEHAQQAEEDPASVSTHGVQTSCALNKSSFFHITTNYTPDIMHDILEGVGKMEVKLVLSQLIEENCFDLGTLNARICSFNYGFADRKNKPSEIASSALRAKDSSLKNSATQMWCLLRLLPLMIGDKVPRNHSHWVLLMKLLDIMDIIFARAVTEGMCHFLRFLIQDHHSLFKKLFPDTNLTPKHHFMVHYPDVMIQVGPIVNGWCMRYEAKHAIGKTLASVVCNFKDICYTIAERHQIRQCHQWFATGAGVEQVVQGTVSSLLVSDIDRDGKELLLNKVNGLMETDEVYTTNRVSFKGTEYRTGMMVAIGFSKELPVFGNLKAVFIVGDVVYLFGDVWTTDHFDDHFHAYGVRNGQVKHFLLKASELIDYHPLHACTTHSEDGDRIKYIATRSQLI